MENIHTAPIEVSIKKVILMMISVLALVLIINFLYIHFSNALIIGGGSSGCTTCGVCTSGQTRCIDSNTYQTCQSGNWGANQSCSGSTACGYGTCTNSQRPQWYCSNGGCVYSCYNDSTCQPIVPVCNCTWGSWYNTGCNTSQGCMNQTKTQTCNPYGCQTAQTQTQCVADSSCQYTPPCGTGCGTPCNPVCPPPTPTCTNDYGCTYSGQKRCNGEGYYQVCSDTDSDGCLEWGSNLSCPGDTCNGTTLRHYTCDCHSSCSNGCTYVDTPNSSQCGYSNPITVSCYASPNPANTNQSVSFIASASGGTGSYSYSWSGNCSGSSQTCSNSFSSSGTYTANIYVTSGSQTGSANCSVVVSCPQPTCTNECSYIGLTDCVGNAIRTCGNYDSDTCLEWNTTQTCSGSTSCGYGSCSSNQRPQWYCSNGGCTYSCYNDSSCNTYNPISVSCYASPNPANTNQSVSFIASASGGTGSYSYSWSGNCSGSSQTCSNSFSSSGTYTANIYVTSGSQTGSANCSVSVSCNNNNCCNGGNCNNYLGCYNDDVYWYNYSGSRQNLYQSCGDDYCDNFGQTYCYNGDAYRMRTCYNRGCSGSACYSYTNTEQQLVQDCGVNQTCQNGQCTTQCECTSGPCCDGCHYKSSTTACDTQTDNEYGCPWGTGCGSDIGKRLKSRFKYCSGYNATCTGEWHNWGDWTNWFTTDYCSNTSVCKVGNQTCTYSASCSAPTLTKGCYNNDVYWFDVAGIRQNKYKSCADENTCTIDGCTDAKCTNQIKCDGTTCEKGSKDYCSNCSHCGDGVCNCDETPCGCPADCKVESLSLSLLSKPTQQITDWQKAITAKPNEDLQFMLILSNNGDSSLDNVFLTAAIPAEITYSSDAKIDGIPVAGDIRTGISISGVAPKTIKTITFSGKVAKAGLIDLNKTEIGFNAQATVKNVTASDSIKISLGQNGTGNTNIGIASISEILRGWLLWIAVILIAIVLVAVGGFYLIFWLIRQRRQRQVLWQKQEVTLK